MCGVVCVLGARKIHAANTCGGQGVLGTKVKRKSTQRSNVCSLDVVVALDTELSRHEQTVGDILETNSDTK